MQIPNGPGGRGSIPALVMRTGLIQPVDPLNARADISTAHVLDVTEWPTAHVPSPLLAPPLTQMAPAPEPVSVALVAAAAAAQPPKPISATVEAPSPNARESDKQMWHLNHRRARPLEEDMRRLHPGALGESPDVGTWNGRPLAKFEIAAQPTSAYAHQAINALRQAARMLRSTGLSTLPAELVGGPLAVLARGGAVELHFHNGVAVRAAP